MTYQLKMCACGEAAVTGTCALCWADKTFAPIIKLEEQVRLQSLGKDVGFMPKDVKISEVIRRE